MRKTFFLANICDAGWNGQRVHSVLEQITSRMHWEFFGSSQFCQCYETGIWKKKTMFLMSFNSKKSKAPIKFSCDEWANYIYMKFYQKRMIVKLKFHHLS